MTIKSNYVMLKVDVPKRITLLNSRIFIARYKRISRSQLPENVILRRKCRQRAAPRGRLRRGRGVERRREQERRGLFSFV